MRVAYIVGQGAGGLSHYTAELANAVAKHHDVTVLKPERTDADDMFSEQVDVREVFDSIDITLPKIYDREINPLRSLRGIFSYRNLTALDDLDVDVVHDPTGLFPHVQLFFWYYDIDFRFPVVVTYHEVSNERFAWKRLPMLLTQLMGEFIPDLQEASLVVHTDEQRDVLISQGTDPRNVRVIPHGAYSVFGGPEDVDVDTEPNSLLFFGHVVPPKGIDTLIEAIPIVKREIPDVKLVIAGDGKIPSHVQGILDAHSENFEVHNEYIPNDEVKRHFVQAELVVTPYREQEGMRGHSGALATAFSFGKPVVATAVGAFRSLVEETNAGTVVPPDDPERLAEAIVTVLENDDRKAEMAENSRRMAERLSWESVAEAHVELYESLL